MVARTRSVVRTTLIVLLLALPASGPIRAQDAEDELGNWLIYNGTVRFSDRWSLFTEAQLRLWEIASNPNEVFARAAGQYHTSANSLVALGYMHSKVEPFEIGNGTTEARIYEQFTLGHGTGPTRFEHRFRLEQRWFRARAGLQGAWVDLLVGHPTQ